MKGISAVIATILMLVITIALAGTAYLYISGIFTVQTQAIEVSDSFCDASGNVSMSIRNDGTNPVSSISCLRTNPSPNACNASFQYTALNFTCTGCSPYTLPPGQSNTWPFADSCPGTGARSCQYRLTPSSGRTITTQVTCT